MKQEIKEARSENRKLLAALVIAIATSSVTAAQAATHVVKFKGADRWTSIDVRSQAELDQMMRIQIIEQAESNQEIRVARVVEVLASTPVASHEAMIGLDEVLSQDLEAPTGEVVAVIDSGVIFDHPQLRGRVDVTRSIRVGGGNPQDSNGHGTAIAGLIAANEGSNEVRGVSKRARILSVAFLNPNGSGTLAHAIEGIQYAIDQGAKVINLSWGGGTRSEALEQTICDASKKGVVVVASAGNNGLNLETNPQYPA